MKPIISAIALLLIVSACAPISHTRGNFVDPERFEGFALNTTKKSDVISALGTPTAEDPFNDNVWFYIGEKTEQTAFFKPEVVERNILEIYFNEDDTLANIRFIDEASGREVNLVDKTTPTSGLSLSIIQQFITNLGRFNQSQGGDSARNRDGYNN